MAEGTSMQQQTQLKQSNLPLDNTLHDSTAMIPTQGPATLPKAPANPNIKPSLSHHLDPSVPLRTMSSTEYYVAGASGGLSTHDRIALHLEHTDTMAISSHQCYNTAVSELANDGSAERKRDNTGAKIKDKIKHQNLQAQKSQTTTLNVHESTLVSRKK